MSWLQRLLRRDRLEQELDDEVRFHLEQLVADYRADGLTEADARRRAAREFGVVESIKDECRHVRGTDWLVDLLADVRIGLRVFSKEPGFSSIAVAALALGLGVNTVFFSIVNTYCLTGLPYPLAARLADVSIRDELGREHPLSSAQVRAITDLPSVEGLGYYTMRTAAVRAPESIATRRTIAYVSDDLLSLIGETPTRGRAFGSAEYREAHATSVLIAAELARELFGSDAAAVGRDIRVDGATSTIVGVFPDRTRFPDNADVWAPLSSLALADDAFALTLFLQPKEVATIGGAAPMIERALRQHGVLTSDSQHVSVVPLNDRYHGSVTDPVWIAFITAGLLVVVIACANVSNLLLARGVRRTDEIAIRLSLGATRGRIVRQLFAETLTLVMAACAASLFFGWAGLHGLLATIPRTALPYWAALGLSWRAVVFVIGIGAVTVLLSGMAPALQLVRVPGVPFTARTSTQGRTIGRWSSAFLVIQIAISVLLLCAMGITLQVYRTLANAAGQTELAQVLSAGVTLSSQRYAVTPARERFLTELRRRLLSSGQVQWVSIAGALPGTRGEPRIVAGGAIRAPGGFVSTVAVDATFFSTLGVPLVSGHEFTDRDADRNGSSVVVNDRFAQLFFGTRAVVGQQVRVQSATGAVAPDTRTIVGVVRLPGANPAVNGPPLMFVPRPVAASTESILLLRGTVPPDGLAALLRESVQRLDPDVPLSNVRPLPQATREANWNARVSQTLISSLAFVGFCLAMIGVAALTAHRVATRARELSIRVALGATPAMLVRAVLGPVVVQLSFGVLGGALLARGWQRAFGSQIAASDNLALVIVLVSATTLLFSAWPARRAARVNPIDALHADG
jgi:putative ABC transport system permease protein